MLAVVWSARTLSGLLSNLADAGRIHLNGSRPITTHRREWMWNIKEIINLSFSPIQVSMDFMAMKRSQLYSMANNPYSTPQQPGGGPYPPSQPYTSPPPHRYPMSMQGRGQMGMGGMQYPQQQVCQQTLRFLYACDSWTSNPPQLCSAEPHIVAGIMSDIAVGHFASHGEHSPAVFPWRLGMFNLRRSLKYQAAHLTPWHVAVSLLFITQFPH